jgi:hypothetical protein
MKRCDVPSIRPIPFKAVAQLLSLLLLSALASAQSSTPSRIAERIDEARLTALRGNVHMLARAQFDQGVAPDSLPMNRILLILRRAGGQEEALRAFLDEQQDKSSTRYHQWLTPDQFGQQFGPSDQDVQTVVSWLQSHGFRTGGISRGRTVVEFSGTAGQVQQTFHTAIHKYVVNGEEHWANSSDPQIPVALAPVIAGVASLHNFPKRPLHRIGGEYSKSIITGNVMPINPQFSFTSQGNEFYAVGPYDFAKIYNVLPLWGAGIDGTGQSIAIVGQTNINIQDVRDFRTAFNLPKTDPQIILDGPDPGIIPGDETESDLDVEWSGAVAKGATIKFVISASTNSSSGVDLSALYIVDNNLAPILSESYGACELSLGSGNNLFFNNLWEQAAAQGITVVVSSGDSGAADCDLYQGTAPEPANNGLMVNGIASTPFDVAVGGTDLMNFGSTWNVLAPGTSTYWNVSDDSNQASVKSYIPETTWNDSCANSAFDYAYESSAEVNCNDSRLMSSVWTVGGGGGTSNCTSSDGVQPLSCSGGYPKPSWQTGDGVPNDNARDLPDISLFAGNGFANSFYIVCESDQAHNGASCKVSSNSFDFLGVGGTSASAPAFAGIMALANQYTNSGGVGNVNYVLYKISALASQKGLNCSSTFPPAAACILNDIVSGTIAMPCAAFKPNCNTSNPTDQFGLLSGYAATNGYDLATGLGSINANNLVHGWDSVTFIPTQTTLSLNGDQPAQIVHGQSVPFTISVTSNAGPPTGQVSLIADTASGQPAGTFTLSNGSATSAAGQLPGGTYAVTAHYLGDGVFGGSSSSPSVPITVQPESSATSVTVLTADQYRNPVPFSGGPYGSFVYFRADITPAMRVPGVIDSPPTGAVTFRDTYNGPGSSLTGGNPYALNSLGYTITPRGVFNLGAGLHSISSSYSGDSSYGPSSTTTAANFTITPVQTSVDVSWSISPNNTAPIGTPVSAKVTVYTTSNGDPPTGTLTFFNGVTQIGTPVPITGSVDPLTHFAEASSSFPLSSLHDGENDITAKYSGDVNYLSSDGSSPLYLLISTTTTVTSSNPAVAQGTDVTFTAYVSANQQGGPAVNGSVDFVQAANSLQFGYFIGQNVPVTNGVAQITTNDVPADFLLTGTVTVSAYFHPNNNYSDSSGSTTEMVTPLPGTDFSIGANPSSVTIASPGGSSPTVILTITALNGFDGTVTFSPASCSILPAGSLSSCSVSPTGILGSGTTQVTVNTTAPRKAISLRRRYPDRWNLNHPHSPSASEWVLFGFAFLLIVKFATRPRHWGTVFCMIVFICMVSFIGCGGSSAEGGGGGGVGPTIIPGTPTGVVYTVTVTGSCGPLSHSTSFTFVVQ